MTTNKTPSFDLIITCADGLEKPLMTELDSFGVGATLVRTGRVAVSVSLAKLYHICLYSRVASRVLLPLGEYYFKYKEQDGKKVIADDVPECLYQYAKRLDWSALFGVDNTFAIRLSVDKRVAVNQQFATLRIKDAIADSFNEKFGTRPNVDKNPQFAIMVHIGAECAEIALDLSGTSLHRRGYRVANTDAPLKENLAAALLYECDWHLGKFDALIDPMCGSGTFVIEALLMATNYPVGIDKATDQFGFYHWQYHDDNLWQACVNTAMDNFHQSLNKPLPKILAMDGSLVAIKATHKNLLASALNRISDQVILKQQELAKLPHTLKGLSENSSILILTNPPYGERLGDEDLIKPLYQGLGMIIKDNLPTQSVYLGVLANKIEEADTLPLVNTQTLRCHNGALTVYFRGGQLNNKPVLTLIERFEKQVIDNPPAQEFINRLQKNLSVLKKQACKNQVSNLRIYDADLPNFNVAIDIYGDKVHIQEYAPPKTIDAQTAKERFNLVLLATRQVLNISREDIYIKTRAKQAGNEQYIKQGSSGKKFVVRENNAYFYVNFTDYLDTGLFIDHRNMRQLVSWASHHKRVLNLFAYTCSASVHSALAGADYVCSVDLSNNYLQWGKQNFALNGLMLDERYEFVAFDVFEWIKNNTEQFDVIFIDPPTFSNSKKFKGTFDVQRDHVALLNRAMNRLTANGVLYFSNNFTRFELDESIKARYDVKEITHKTIGFDFDIKKPIHQSFEIRHKNAIKSTIVEIDDKIDSEFKGNTQADNLAKSQTKTHDKSHSKGVKSKEFKPKEFKSKELKSKNKELKSKEVKPKAFKSDKSNGNQDKVFKSNTRRPNSKKVAETKPNNQPNHQPSTKRVYVNPKLANHEEIAKRLNQTLNTEPTAQSTTSSKYKVKRHDN